MFQVFINMLLHINKDRLLNAFEFQEDDFDTKTNQMIEDALSSRGLADFRTNYPDSFQHFIEEIHIEGEDLEESYDEFLEDLLIAQIFEDEEDIDEDDEY